MKKALLLLASAAMLLVGCAKEQLSNGVDGGMTSVTFSASVDGGVATKAAAYNDGNGAYVNRCIMEIYFQNQLYTRLVQPVTPAAGEAKAYATFANVPVVAGKEYQILFWADCGGAEKSDLYYTTTSLKAVTVAKTAFIGALVAGDNDKLDAFFFAETRSIPQSGDNSYTVSLKRPFAQLNVITTDINKTVTSAALLPDKVSVSYTAADVFDVATGAISSSKEDGSYTTYTYEADVYGTWSDTTELTLSMDYLLASTEQELVNVTFVTKNGGQAVMTHSLTNLPYKRNYRTNVKGDLLTTNGSWKAEIEPKWGNGTDTGEIDYKIATSYTEVKTALQSGDKSDNLKVTVTPAAVNNLSEAEKEEVIVDETIDGESVKALQFILYEEKKDGDQITQQASPKHVEFELPKRPTDVEAWKIQYEPAYPTETVVVSTKEEDNANVIIEAPKSTVTLDATKINSVVSTTSENTLIIPQGLELKNLTVKKGAVEYHGTGLTKVTIATEGVDKAYFKTSEGLANTDDVYGVVKDHIAEGFAITKESADTWKIVPTVCKIGETGYGSVADAFAAVENGQTIVMLQNDVLTKGQTITLANNDAFTLDLNGKKISIAETGFDFTANGTNSSVGSIPARFAIVVNGNGTMNICDSSTDKLGRLETKNYGYNTTKTILVNGNAVVNVNSGTIAADYAAFYVVGYTGLEQIVPENSPIPSLNISGGKIIGQKIGIGLKGKTATVTVTGGEIVGEEIYGISTNGTTDWYDGGNCRINISGGSVKSINGLGMYLPAESITEITGGTIEGATGIGVKGGLLSISDNAVVKAIGSKKEEAHAVLSGCSETGSCIYVEDTYENHAPIVNISGGKFSSVNNKAVEYFTSKTDDATNKGKITLSGGIYSDAPDASFVADGYAVLDNSDAVTKSEYPKTVKVKPVVKIGNVEYADIADAFAAVPTDGTPTTVTLLENIGSKNGEEIVWKEYDRVYVYTINKDQNVTFDLNGHKIYGKTTVNGETCFFRVENGGNLTIQDSLEGGELNYLDGNDNTGGFGICSAGNLTIKSGTIENHTECKNSAIQGAIDVHANEWGTPYASHVTFKMDGGVLKSHNDNTLRIYDSSQTGTGGVVIDSEINGGEIYGADAVFIMTQWTKQYCTGETYMNDINVNVKGGKFVTKNGIRVVGNVGDDNNKDYMAIKIDVSGGEFNITDTEKYRVNNVAFQESAGWTSTDESTKHLRSYTEVNWTASEPKYETPAQQ